MVSTRSEKKHTHTNYRLSTINYLNWKKEEKKKKTKKNGFGSACTAKNRMKGGHCVFVCYVKEKDL